VEYDAGYSQYAVFVQYIAVCPHKSYHSPIPPLHTDKTGFVRLAKFTTTPPNMCSAHYHGGTLCPPLLDYWAATDASKEGVGRFWLPSTITPDQQPCVWRHKFEATISASLLTYDTPKGTLCNSDLDLAAIIVGHATQNHHCPPPPHFLQMHLHRYRRLRGPSLDLQGLSNYCRSTSLPPLLVSS
jgi:hypothetical protein